MIVEIGQELAEIGETEMADEYAQAVLSSEGNYICETERK